jgi:transmembrane sensor
MKSAPQLKSHSRDADTQARDWFVLMLNEQVGQEQLAAWSEWLEADPRHAEAYARVANVWELAADSLVALPTPASLQADHYSPVLAIRAWRRLHKPDLRLVAGIAAVLAVAAVTLAVRSFLPQPATQRYETQHAQQMRTMLQDGSQVSLGAMTALEVKLEARRRGIDLKRGEAFFKVAHDKSRPFTVQTPMAPITAVGTKFNIDVSALAVVLTVTEGVVRIDAPGQAGGVQLAQAPLLSVAAGHKVRMRRSGDRLVLVESEAEVEPTWWQGRLEYRDEPLRTVIDAVNRYAKRPVIIADAHLGALTYTGTVKLDSADAWALGLAEAFPLVVQINEQNQIVLKEKVQNLLPTKSRRAS